MIGGGKERRSGFTREGEAKRFLNPILGHLNCFGSFSGSTGYFSVSTSNFTIEELAAVVTVGLTTGPKVVSWDASSGPT